MKVLIVDDNQNNRSIISILLKDYMDERDNVNFEIDEVSDGLEAVDQCRKVEYDLVLMDIMMPNMDGVEATKIIRHEHKNVMIVAISAVKDGERKKLIFANGAEDYISIPVNASVFKARITNYIALINAREHALHRNLMSANPFTQEIFSRHTKFLFFNEDAIAEFWEFFLLNNDTKYNGTCDVVRTIFVIAERMLKLKCIISATVEESERFQYFTIENIDKIPSSVISLIVKRNGVLCEHKIEDGKLSFKLEKVLTAVEKQVIFVEKIVERETEPEVAQSNYVSQELQVYSYLEEEDMLELEEYVRKLSSLMLLVGAGDNVVEEEIVDIYTNLEKIGSILATYSEVYVISKALGDLSADLSSHITEFMENSEALGPMCSAFSKDLTTWMEQSFYTGAPSVDFMNDTIAVNCQTIGSMLKMDDAVAEELDDFDDIFDF